MHKYMIQQYCKDVIGFTNAQFKKGQGKVKQMRNQSKKAERRRF